MQKDKLVIDIETKNTFADVGGQDKVRDLDASLIGVYSYNQDKLFAVREGNFEELVPVLKDAGMIIGFSSNRFDIPVMQKYFDFNLSSIPSFDILEEIQRNFGRRVGLGVLCQENLNADKTGHGLDAIKYYNEGDWDSLESYCLQDVALTRDLYELIRRQGYLIIPQKWGDPVKLQLSVMEPSLERPNTLF